MDKIIVVLTNKMKYHEVCASVCRYKRTYPRLSCESELISGDEESTNGVFMEYAAYKKNEKF